MAGHVRSIAPLAWALRSAGHEVVVVSRPNMLPTILARGLPARAVGTDLDIIGGLRRALPAGSSVQETWGRADSHDHLIGAAHQSAENAQQILGELREFAGRWRPDLVVYDPLEYAARLVADELGVPSVRHRWAVDPYTTTLDTEALRTLGVDGALAPDLVLDPCPPSLQLPGVPAGQSVRYLPDNGGGEVPDWTLDTPTRPTVCVCLGTEALSLGGGPAFRNTIAALATLDVDVIAAVNPRDLDHAGAVPEHIRVVNLVPLRYFLHQCTAIVHHGGAGCLLTAVAAGLPQLVLPVIGDQFANGERIAATGAGVCLDSMADQRDPAAVSTAIRQVLEDAALTTGAKALQAENDHQPDALATVGTLEKLTT
jgi:UDP:flavonoid glycosyltransferase YjiC (YdhE family)